ncbi:immunoglobulin gamma-1 heavy chain-like [Mauremys reevesii]|uniref:immunoglobulin gamma-1 heavy chain-like n=1 Tax=Mauremys reevesii TaxID=260615 RepID=UPI00194003FC|nr:immunoglobulin gamma-1 heavy chain-like [Mauremys reevesii]
MLLLQVLIVTSTWSYGSSQITLIQTPLSVTREETKTARMGCKILEKSFNFNSAYIHWYRQSPGEAPKRILYIGSRSAIMDEGFDKEKFEAEKVDSASTSNLRVHQLTREDAATYYCATWDRTVLKRHRQPIFAKDLLTVILATTSGVLIKVFGSGTKLIVTDIQAKLDSTKIQVLPPFTEQDGKVSYMCFIEDFYPNVIKVTWEAENKNEEKNGVHEEIWPPDDNQQSYSLSSWLTIDKDSSKNYSCKYQHEIQGGFVPTKSPDKSVVSQTAESCINKPGNGTTLSTGPPMTMSSWLTVDTKSNKNYRFKYQHESKEGFVPTKSPDKPVVSQTTGGCSQKPENGTTLSTDIPAKLDSTKIQALPPSTEKHGKVSYMCFIQDFYPNVIKVTWEDEKKKNAEKNAVHEEIWPPGDNQQSYSLSSWLTVDKNSNKNYRCKYQHEIKEDYVPMESPADTFADTTVIPQTTTSCIKFAENNTTLSTDIMDSYIHRTAYFIYIVLLLKSTMYYIIVLFFIYRMQSPIKHQGKKP